MKQLLKALTLGFVLVLLVARPGCAQLLGSGTADYDAVRDFSLASNPNGVWSYGSINKLGGPFTLYAVTCTGLFGLQDSSWAEPGCNTPYVLHNDSTQPICFESICVPPQDLLLDIGNNGLGPFFSDVRWTAPESGTFTIRARVEGLDYVGPTTTDFFVVVNSNKLAFTATIDSYQQPLFFQRMLTVSAGDTIDFTINEGRDHDWHFDSTGLEVQITRAQ